jgi:hypothetical protein
MASSNSNNITRLLDPGVFGEASTVGQVVAGSSGGGGSSADSTQQLAQQLQQLESLAQAETEMAEANTQATNQNTTQVGQGGGGQSALGQAGSTLESIFGAGLSPLLSGVMGLFGGGGGQGSVPTTFLMPPSVNVNAGINEAAPTQPFAVDYAAGGQPRPATGGSEGSAQITVQIQALDSQSFLDHSDDIAQAVRQAMLQSSVLNDVIREV